MELRGSDGVTLGKQGLQHAAALFHEGVCHHCTFGRTGCWRAGLAISPAGLIIACFVDPSRYYIHPRNAVGIPRSAHRGHRHNGAHVTCVHARHRQLSLAVRHLAKAAARAQSRHVCICVVRVRGVCILAQDGEILELSQTERRRQFNSHMKTTARHRQADEASRCVANGRGGQEGRTGGGARR